LSRKQLNPIIGPLINLDNPNCLCSAVGQTSFVYKRPLPVTLQDYFCLKVFQLRLQRLSRFQRSWRT